MFHIGDTVMYGSSGVCRITDLKDETVAGEKQTYYLLTPERDPRSTYYCPVDRAEKLRPLLTEKEARDLLRQAPEAEAIRIPEENLRREQFTAILKNGDQLQLIRLIRSLLCHRREREAEGKRLPLADQRILDEARRMLYGELTHVLSLPPDRVSRYIESDL